MGTGCCGLAPTSSLAFGWEEGTAEEVAESSQMEERSSSTTTETSSVPTTTTLSTTTQGVTFGEYDGEVEGELWYGVGQLRWCYQDR